MLTNRADILVVSRAQKVGFGVFAWSSLGLGARVHGKFEPAQVSKPYNQCVPSISLIIQKSSQATKA